MSQTRWIHLNPSTLQQAWTEDIDGQAVSMKLSPYDLPMFIGTNRDGPEHYAVIRFQFAGPEKEFNKIKLPEGGWVRKGAETGRIYEIAVPARSVMNIPGLLEGVTMRRALNVEGSTAPQRLVSMLASLAKAIRDNLGAIVQQLSEESTAPARRPPAKN